MSTFAFLMSFVAAGYATDAQAAGRLAAWRAARTAAAETTAAAAVAKTAALRAPQPTAVQPVAMQAPAPAPVGSEPLPAASPAGCVVCCPQPCIIYKHRGHHRACCDCCAPPIETVLTATDPCTCCPVAIPVCVPGCCTCAPTMTCHDGLFCSGVVQYDWSCGYRVTVRFKHNGDVVVVSRG
jgi:hypothetical protein